MTAEEIEMQMPYQKWFWRDWLADQAILMLPPEHRCIWFEMLGLMASSENPGYLETFGVEPELYISFQRRINVKSVKSGMAAIEKLGLFSRDDSGKIYSRRIIREADELQRQLHNGSKGGRPKTQPQNPEPKPTTETPIAIAKAIAKTKEKKKIANTISKENGEKGVCLPDLHPTEVSPGKRRWYSPSPEDNQARAIRLFNECLEGTNSDPNNKAFRAQNANRSQFVDQIRLALEENTWEDLEKAIEAYALEMDEAKTESRFRKTPNNFFSEGMYRQYLPEKEVKNA